MTPTPGEILVDDDGNVNLFIPTAMAFGEAPPPNQPLPPLNPNHADSGELKMVLDLEGGSGPIDEILRDVHDFEPVTLYWANATVTARAGTIRGWIGD